jgi:ketosteroid isomerase-like protein
MIKAALFTFLCLLPPLALAAGDADIRAAEKAWAGAVMARDLAALDRIFGNDLIYAHSTGVIETKAQYIDRLRGGAQRYDKVEHENIRVVPYGDAAVSHSTVRMMGTSNGKPFNDHVMMMHLWVRQGGAWKLVAHQTTRLAQ